MGGTAAHPLPDAPPPRWPVSGLTEQPPSPSQITNLKEVVNQWLRDESGVA
jgi:hypothetical protein